ncbi:Bifunctional protein PaaZ [Nymphon striatum]|nr:Bifunctional protein PaaZ [Nymphon striatum]
MLMSVQDVSSFAAGEWIKPDENAREIASAVTGEVIARAGNTSLEVESMLEFGRNVGGPALRKMTFHDRAKLVKAVGQYLNQHKQALYDISFATGATQKDHVIDIDGGIGTLFVFASKGRREMPDAKIYLDGELEQLSRNGTFMGHHICTPKRGVGVHINAFNFPVWGMLEKLAPALLAGVPVIVKPATATCYVTELCVRLMLDSGILPKGALQLVSGSLGNMLSHLTSQDTFLAEQDSLNASILGPDAQTGTPEFDLFAKEVVREMTTKAGQKCTAIRRIFVPENQVEAMIETLRESLSNTTIGDPSLETTRMGALVSADQKKDVLGKVALFEKEGERVFGDPENFEVVGADADKGAFVPPMLFHCPDPDSANDIHTIEAFGPVSTIMPYSTLEHAIELANRGQGSLVASVVTNDSQVAEEVALGAGAYHGRLYFNNRDSMQESTGHGSPLPHMVHGGPGRAGGGEELGGVRGVMHYMQRTAIQGSPDILTAIGQKWVPGAMEKDHQNHPFTRGFHELEIGETLKTKSREITLDDIELFANFTGDTFYAHMDDAAAKRNPFFPGRVAHGYLLLSFAAGLFVQPDEGPVLANTGLDNLRFMKPVEAGESIKVRLTVKQKTPRNDEYGEVRWHVSVSNQNDELVAEYELLTMNAY